MSQRILELRERGLEQLWSHDLRSMHGARKVLLNVVRISFVMGRDLMQGQLTLRAMSLVYTTLLSVVPLLAVSFSVLKAFGVHNQLEPLLLKFLAPLGPKSVQISDNVLAFVENVKVGVLGAIGLAFLFYTVVSLTQKVERALNYVWRVERLRGFRQRFSNYLSVIVIGPVLVFSALGISATVMGTDIVKHFLEVEPFGYLIVLATKLVPYLLVMAAFTFFYMFIPNTQVRFLPALIGGMVAGLLWEMGGWVFAAFIATSTKYAAIYSGFAILIMLLIWVYLSWLVLLLGAQIAFYVQHPEYVVREPVDTRLSNRVQERLVLLTMFLIAERYLHKREPWTADALVQHIGLPSQPVHRVLGLLLDCGYLSETTDEPPVYLPRQDVGAVTLTELLDVARSTGENRLSRLTLLSPQQQVENTMATFQDAWAQALAGQTLRDLVDQPGDLETRLAET